MTGEDFQADLRQERHDDERREQSMHDLVDQLETAVAPLLREHQEVKAARHLVHGTPEFDAAWQRITDLHDIAELAQ